MKWMAILLAGVRLSGASDACARCHPSQAKAHASTPMARALERVEECEILRDNPKLAFRSGAYAYTIERQGKQSIYTVTDGQEKLSVPIDWAFGLGAAGQTYTFQKDGVRYETRVSYFKKTGGLDLTLGANSVPPRSLREAAGREMSNKDVVDCFGCHSSGRVREGRLELESVVEGVQCVNCHNGADKHVSAIQRGDAKAAALPKLGKLNAEEMSERCGACHRTWADIAATGPRGIGNVRFPPYRIANSKCYDAFDARIGCTACHDQHGQLETRAVAYDAKCLTCHAGTSTSKTTRVCHTGKAECSTCHMPKYEIPGSHHLFSDHQIRIARANDVYPN